MAFHHFIKVGGAVACDGVSMQSGLQSLPGVPIHVFIRAVDGEIVLAFESRYGRRGTHTEQAGRQQQTRAKSQGKQLFPWFSHDKSSFLYHRIL